MACASISLEPTVTLSQRSLSVVRSASNAMFSGVVSSVSASDHSDQHFHAFVIWLQVRLCQPLRWRCPSALLCMICSSKSWQHREAAAKPHWDRHDAS